MDNFTETIFPFVVLTYRFFFRSTHQPFYNEGRVFLRRVKEGKRKAEYQVQTLNIGGIEEGKQ